MLFCDWSYESYLDRINHKPYFFEKWFIANERRCIRSAAACVSMFPDAAEKMNQQLGLKKTIWGGRNAPNILDIQPFESESIINICAKSPVILFIGDGKYIKGARLLVEAYKVLRKSDHNIELHVVGLTESQLVGIDVVEGLHCYGYLDKNNPGECARYYDLLRKAAVFCNPTEIWGGYSSTYAPDAVRIDMCKAAHMQVSQCDWKSYSARLLSLINHQ